MAPCMALPPEDGRAQSQGSPLCYLAVRTGLGPLAERQQQQDTVFL